MASKSPEDNPQPVSGSSGELDSAAARGRSKVIERDAPEELRTRFQRFLLLLELNNRVLKLISDMEEKSQGDFLFDINYINRCVDEISGCMEEIAGILQYLGGDTYRPLRRRLDEITRELEFILQRRRPVRKAEYTYDLDRINRHHAELVGAKNANLGEIRTKLGLPVPDGFAISAWAYKHFIDANNLRQRIEEKINSVDYHNNEDLLRTGREIREMIKASSVPDDLAQALRNAYHRLMERNPGTSVALRSSAIGEDTSHSFAGQYDSFLNVGQSNLLDRYVDILVSKFTPRAIYYYLSHSITESDLAMGVVCQVMVDARASGVVYSRNPVPGEQEMILVHSVFGLGEYLMNGTLTPDRFQVDRETLEPINRTIAEKPVQSKLAPNGGTIQEPVDPGLRLEPSIDEEHLRELAGYARDAEEYFGEDQDIEWSISGEGRLFILQARPLHVIQRTVESPEVDISGCTVLYEGGETVCPGAGAGKVYRIDGMLGQPPESPPKGSVVVTEHPIPCLITALADAAAVVTRIGGVAGHFATIAREYNVPMLAGMQQLDKLQPGMEVTVDATGKRIFLGTCREIVEAGKMDTTFDDLPVYRTLNRVLKLISPLRLIDPTDPNFTAENCGTYHDITRFAHQKSIEELFRSVKGSDSRKWTGDHLGTEYPVNINILLLDETVPTPGGRSIPEDRIPSRPMQHFWNGVMEQGWHNRAMVPKGRGSLSAVAARATDKAKREYSDTSFAVLSGDYMLLSMRMGFHFLTIEAMAADEPSKNFIKLQHKGGGASRERRIRRIKLISDIVTRLGFEHHSEHDVLDTLVSYYPAQKILETLHLLGRLTMMTKQLDMALSNDIVAEWYTRDFMKRLNLENNSTTASETDIHQP